MRDIGSGSTKANGMGSCVSEGRQLTWKIRRKTERTGDRIAGGAFINISGVGGTYMACSDERDMPANLVQKISTFCGWEHLVSANS